MTGPTDPTTRPIARTHDRPATIKQVAQHAGVALSSVSRVINEHPDVSADMRQRVLRAVAELGYEPDLLASSLRRGSTRTIGFLVADIVNPLFAQIFGGAEQRLREAGYSVILAHSEGDPERDVEGARLLRRRRVDGLIIAVADDTRPDTTAELAGLDLPLVLIDRQIEGLDCSAVLADHRTGMRRATEHLLDLGHRRIALITGPLAARPARERILGFEEGFARREAVVPTDLRYSGSVGAEHGQHATEELLRLPDPPTAIIAGGNVIFVGVVTALHRTGRALGPRMSLICCDDVPLAEFHAPPVTVVRRDIVEMGRLAARFMLDNLRDGGSPRVETIPTELLLRESTFPLG